MTAGTLEPGIDLADWDFWARPLSERHEAFRTLRALPRPGAVMIDAHRLRRIAAMLLPAAVFVAAIPLMGLHVASGVYVFAMIAAHRRMATWKALATPPPARLACT